MENIGSWLWSDVDFWTSDVVCLEALAANLQRMDLVGCDVHRNQCGGVHGGLWEEVCA